MTNIFKTFQAYIEYSDWSLLRLCCSFTTINMLPWWENLKASGRIYELTARQFQNMKCWVYEFKDKAVGRGRVLQGTCSQGVLAKTVGFSALVEIIRDCITSLSNKDASQYCWLRRSLNFPSHLLCLKSQRSPACKQHMVLSRGAMSRTW